MYAVVRLNAWDDAKRAAAVDDVAEFDRIHSEQPGFLGSLVVDLGDGRTVIVNLWESEKQATSALPVVGPAVGRMLEPLMTEPSRLVGAGEVIQGAELVHGAS
ncbi:hypothetical protein GCM10027053_24670 [Intrasporangium mesophilum]